MKDDELDDIEIGKEITPRFQQQEQNIPREEGLRQLDEPQISGRGFKNFDEIPSSYGGNVRVYESSNAEGPHVWLRTEENMPGQEASEATVHLTLENAKLLADQLNYLVENHYQVAES